MARVPWRKSMLVGVGTAVLVVAVVTLKLTVGGGEGGSISTLVLSTGLGPDGKPLPPPQALSNGGPVLCAGQACGPASPATKTMMDNIRKVLHALDDRLGNIKDDERDWKSSMAHRVKLMAQKVNSVAKDAKKVYFLQQDVKQKLASPGPAGPRGLQGTPGRDGLNGAQGPFGATGPRGIEGVQGKQGAPGSIGAPGVG